MSSWSSKLFVYSLDELEGWTGGISSAKVTLDEVVLFGEHVPLERQDHTRLRI